MLKIKINCETTRRSKQSAVSVEQSCKLYCLVFICVWLTENVWLNCGTLLFAHCNALLNELLQILEFNFSRNINYTTLCIHIN